MQSANANTFAKQHVHPLFVYSSGTYGSCPASCMNVEYTWSNTCMSADVECVTRFVHVCGGTDFVDLAEEVYKQGMNCFLI